MTKREWRRLNETLMTEAQEAERDRRWACAAACWVALQTSATTNGVLIHGGSWA